MTLRIEIVELKWIREDGDVEENKMVCSKNTTQQVRDFEFMCSLSCFFLVLVVSLGKCSLD